MYNRGMTIRGYFQKLSAKVSRTTGSPYSFFIAILIILTWAVAGPVLHFSDTWQLLINTFTTISTFSMVFLIQNTQNRDTKAMQLKLDELLLGVKGARDELIDLEDLTDEEIQELADEFHELRAVIIKKKLAQKKIGTRT